MAFATLSLLLLAAGSAIAHPGHIEEVQAHRAMPVEYRSLDHCAKAFSHPEFVKRTNEAFGKELLRLRREAGIEDENA